MATDEGTAAGGIITAFVLGALAGAAVALLAAPASGEQTRRTLGEKAREGRQRAGDAARQGRELITKGRESLSAAIERGREAYQQARAAGDPGQGGPAAETP